MLGPASSVSFGSLYPALNRLEAAGQVKAVESLGAPLQPAMPSTGSFAGEVAAFRASRRRSTRGPRNKKVYGLTEDGAARLAELLAATEDEDRTFPLKLAFCRWCDPATRLELLERRRATLVERLDERRRSLEDQRLDRYLRALREHDAESTERDIAWLDELITTERIDAGGFPGRGGRPRRDRIEERAHRSRNEHTTQARAPAREDDRRHTDTMSTIKLAIAGIGNCASSLLQGLEYYREADPAEEVPGLMHVTLGGYHISDITLVAAFDVDAAKVGLDVGKAIFAGQNNTIRFAPVGELGVSVQRGPTLDGFGKYYRETVEESPAEPVDVADVLRRSRGRRPRVLPAGRLGAGPEALRPGLPGHRRRLRQRHPRLHRQRPRVGGEVRGRRRAHRG